MISLSKMTRNSEKAYIEHSSSDPCYIRDTSQPMIPFMVGIPASQPLSYECNFATRQGSRNYQEDTAFIIPGTVFLLSAVFDGHSGADVSNFLTAHFANCFGGPYETPDAVHAAFTRTIHSMQEWVLPLQGGAAGVISYVDLEHCIVYTATVGDCEANCYRSGKSISLSPVRHWLSPKDRERFIRLVSTHREVKEDLQTYPNFESLAAYREFYSQLPEWADSKQMRLKGYNVSRAFGDRDVNFNGLGVIAKAKITAATIQSGDTLILASDGVKDQLTESAIADLVNQGLSAKALAEDLVTKAASEFRPSDNVTAVAIRFR